MSKLDDLAKMMVDIIEKRNSKRPRALDTIGTVSRVDDDYVWVKFAGSEEETPVKQTIKAKKGDVVQVRASNGNAWIVGNETSPPSDDTLAQEAYNNSDKASRTAQRASDTTVVGDTMYYLASDQDEGVTTEDEGWTVEPQELSEEYPYLWAYHDYERGNGKHFTSTPVIIAMYAEDGVGVDMIQPQYALSTSSTTNTGTWSTSLTYLSGYYIWTRDKITFTDGTIKYTTAIYDAALTEACSLSYDTAQYFWTKSSGGTPSVPTGSYVTEVPKNTYQSNPTGNSLLMNSDGIKLRNGTNTVATFLAAGVRLYNLAGSLLAEFVSDGVKLYKKVNNVNTQVASFSDREVVLGNSSTGSITMYAADASTYLTANKSFELRNTTGQLYITNFAGNTVNTRIQLTAQNDIFATGVFWADNIHELMTAQATAAVTLSVKETYYKVTTAESISIGNQTSISSGGVKCSKAGYVLVSGQAQFTGMEDHQVCNVQIRKNSTTVAHSASRSAGSVAEVVVAPRLIQVAANDVIYMYVANTSNPGGTVAGSAASDKLKNYLTVQYV